jgi:hypothetical protein
MHRDQILLRRVRWLLLLFMAGLIVSGLTAVPLRWEMELLSRALNIPADASPEAYTGLKHWVATVRGGLRATYDAYPFVAYGTDWLAFAHVLIAVLFVGPLRDPVRNIWVIDFGLIACAAVIPMALIFGPIRGIPFFWQLIDCSFGVVAFVPLWFARKYAKEMA